MNDDWLICDEEGCGDPVAIGRGGYCVTHGDPPKPAECNAPDCENDARDILSRYCSHECENVGLRIASRVMAESEAGDIYEPSDEEVQAIREDVESAAGRIDERIEAYIDSVDAKLDGDVQ